MRQQVTPANTNDSAAPRPTRAATPGPVNELAGAAERLPAWQVPLQAVRRDLALCSRRGLPGCVPSLAHPGLLSRTPHEVARNDMSIGPNDQWSSIWSGRSLTEM